jgi:hypothetical protein
MGSFIRYNTSWGGQYEETAESRMEPIQPVQRRFKTGIPEVMSALNRIRSVLAFCNLLDQDACDSLNNSVFVTSLNDFCVRVWRGVDRDLRANDSMYFKVSDKNLARTLNLLVGGTESLLEDTSPLRIWTKPQDLIDGLYVGEGRSIEFGKTYRVKRKYIGGKCVSCICQGNENYLRRKYGIDATIVQGRFNFSFPRARRLILTEEGPALAFKTNRDETMLMDPIRMVRITGVAEEDAESITSRLGGASERAIADCLLKADLPNRKNLSSMTEEFGDISSLSRNLYGRALLTLYGTVFRRLEYSRSSAVLARAPEETEAEEKSALTMDFSCSFLDDFVEELEEEMALSDFTEEQKMMSMVDAFEFQESSLIFEEFGPMDRRVFRTDEEIRLHKQLLKTYNSVKHLLSEGYPIGLLGELVTAAAGDF